MDTGDIVGSKENIQPLRQGRATTHLKSALQAQHDCDFQRTLEQQRNDFELRLRDTTSEDPLDAWCSYIIWIEQTYLQQPKEGSLRKVLRKCLNKFKNNEQYKNDVRFVKLCIKYADLDDNTTELLNQVYGHGIGVKCADLYIAWAERHAMADGFKEANKIYDKGIKNNAEPKEVLLEAQSNLILFLGRRMLSKDEPFLPTTLGIAIEDSLARQPYNKLKSVATNAKPVVPAVRVGENVLGRAGRLANSNPTGKPTANMGFKIFQDTDGVDMVEGKANIDKLHSKKVTSKENKVKAGVWTDKSKKNVPFTIGAAAPVPFQVHTDEDAGSCAKPLHSVSTALRPKKTTLDYEEETYTEAPLFILEPHDATKRPMYCKDQVYAGGIEFQFEELRAALYRRLKRERTAKEEPVAEEAGLGERSGAKSGDKDPAATSARKDTGAKRKGRSLKFGKEIEPKVPPAPPKVMPLEYSLHDTTSNHTIHTKEALSEMQELWFSKPATPVLKEVAKPPKCDFKLYVDESCLGNFAPERVQGSGLQLPLQMEGGSGKTALADEVEDKENVVPADYCGPVGKSTRAVSGVLTPAENVPLAESSEEEEEDEESEGEDDNPVTENFTKAFQFPKQSSTPNYRKSMGCRPPCNDETLFVAEECGAVGGAEAVPADPAEGKALDGRGLYRANLSAIAETSREYKSSSSGSGGASTFALRMSKNFPYTPSDSRRLTQSDRTKGQSLTGYEASAEGTVPPPPECCEARAQLSVLEEAESGSTSTPDVAVSAVAKELTFSNSAEPMDIADPFSDELLAMLLTGLDFRRRAGPSAHFADTATIKKPKVGAVLRLNEEEFEVKTVVGEGAYAKIFRLSSRASGKQMIAKYQSPAFPWELYITQQVRERVARTNKDMIKYFMNVEDAYFFSNASVLLTPPVEHGDLLSFINKMKVSNTMHHTVAMHFTVQILDILEALHAARIIHADLKPDNFLVVGVGGKQQLQLIDFGRSIDMSLLPDRTTFTKVVTTKDFTCIEMKQGRPWTYQTDLYGAANCGHCLLFGEYMKVVNRGGSWFISKSLPRYVAVAEWNNFFRSLLNVESCENLPNLSALRAAFGAVLDRIQDLDQRFSVVINALNGR